MDDADPLPDGTLTLLFSDIEGSTLLLDRLGLAYRDVLSTQRRILRQAIARHEGREMGTEGDSFFVVFRTAQDAARTVLDNLAPGDTASVVLAGRRADGPKALFAEPTDVLDDVRAEIDKLAPSALGTDLSGAVKRAETRTRKIAEFVEMLARHEAPYPQRARPADPPG